MTRRGVKRHRCGATALAALLALLALAACSNRQVYEAIQANRRFTCQQLPPTQYDDCIESSTEHYEDYRRRREELDASGS